MLPLEESSNETYKKKQICLVNAFVLHFVVEGSMGVFELRLLSPTFSLAIFFDV